MAFHKVQTQGEIHTIYNWIVADATARAALSLVSTDVGKVCGQLDNAGSYILVNLSGPIWKSMTGTVPTWGSITGTLSDQTDLQAELDALVGSVLPFTADGSMVYSGAGAGFPAIELLKPNEGTLTDGKKYFLKFVGGVPVWTAEALPGDLKTANTVLTQNTPATNTGTSSFAIAGVNANTIFITGVNTITSFGIVLAAGFVRKIVFTAANTITHSGSLICPAGVNLTLGAGDAIEIISTAVNTWRVIDVFYAAGTGGGGGGGGGSSSTVTGLTSASGVLTIDCSLGDFFIMSMTENVTSIVFTNLPGSGKGATKFLLINQHASAVKTMAWPASFRWEGTAGIISATVSAKDILAMTTFDNGGKWDVNLSKARV